MLRIALLVALALGVLIAYVASLNSGRVSLALGSNWTVDAPLAALLVGALLAGAALAFLLSALREISRSYQDFQLAQRARRAETLSETYHRGVDAQLAGRTAPALEAYEAVLRREPGHADATARLGELARQRGDNQAALTHDLQALRAGDRPETLLAVADDYRRLGRPDDAVATYRRVLELDHAHLTALRRLREVAAERGRWDDALEAQERLARLVPRDARAAEEGWLAAIHYELGRALLTGGSHAAAIGRFKDAIRVQPDFLPAILALGDTYLGSGDAREAAKVWERALEIEPAPALLSRLEQLHRGEGHPARMIAVHQDAAKRHPENLAVAFGLGRVYFELAMLDEAAEQFEKIEVRAPGLPVIHAFLGAVFERRGQAPEAFEEYRRALGFTETMDWPHHCSGCASSHPAWVDRCPTCRRWNSSRP